MFSLWRYSGLKSNTNTLYQDLRVALWEDVSAPLSWTLRKKLKFHITIQHRHRSLLKNVKHEGFQTRDGIFVKPGDTVELQDGSFVRVKDVLHNEQHDKYWIDGWRFVPTEQTLGLSGKDANEVYWMIHLVKNNPRPAAEQALIRVNDPQILRKKRLIMVNPNDAGHQEVTGASLGVPGDGVLYCRWKHVVLTKIGKLERPLDAFKILAAEILEASFQKLLPEDCEDGHGHRTVNETLRQSWLGHRKKGGAHTTSEEPNSILSAFKALSLDRNSGNQGVPPAYTFADVCCGAGGASRGAEMAGFQLRWALDHSAAACETYRLNFPAVRLYHKPVKDLVNLRHEDSMKVDIMHLSPPCQAFSSANTTRNPSNDTANIAANMEIGNCLDVARPRVATLEQTSGLMSLGHSGGRHGRDFGRIIAQFTSRGYSIAWKNVNLAELGLPQRRKRLLMIASCPGEPLPHFPPQTHTRHPNPSSSISTLEPHTTISSALASIPTNHTLPPPLKVPRQPYPANAPFPHTILTESTNVHPTGLRTFSLRELACLQGFPLEHRFGEREVMRQIGNAFPPCVGGVLYACIGAQLRARDGGKMGSV